MRHVRDEPPLRGPAFGLQLTGFTVLGALLGIVSAFFVPFGYRFGVVTGPIAGASSAPTQSLAAASQNGSYGTLLSVGVALALTGLFVLGIVTRQATGSRLAPLGPISGWLVIALLALSQVRGDLVLPVMVSPNVQFLFAGVIGGSVTLLPTILLPARFRGGWAGAAS